MKILLLSLTEIKSSFINPGPGLQPYLTDPCVKLGLTRRCTDRWQLPQPLECHIPLQHISPSLRPPGHLSPPPEKHDKLRETLDL